MPPKFKGVNALDTNTSKNNILNDLQKIKSIGRKDDSFGNTKQNRLHGSNLTSGSSRNLVRTLTPAPLTNRTETFTSGSSNNQFQSFVLSSSTNRTPTFTSGSSNNQFQSFVPSSSTNRTSTLTSVSSTNRSQTFAPLSSTNRTPTFTSESSNNQFQSFVPSSSTNRTPTLTSVSSTNRSQTFAPLSSTNRTHTFTPVTSRNRSQSSVSSSTNCTQTFTSLSSNNRSQTFIPLSSITRTYARPSSKTHTSAQLASSVGGQSIKAKKTSTVSRHSPATQFNANLLRPSKTHESTEGRVCNSTLSTTGTRVRVSTGINHNSEPVTTAVHQTSARRQNFIDADSQLILEEFRKLNERMDCMEKKLDTNNQLLLRLTNKKRGGIKSAPAFLPFKTLQDLLTFDNCDDDAFNELVDYFLYLGGINAVDCAAIYFKNSLDKSEEISPNISWLGQPRRQIAALNKMKFSDACEEAMKRNLNLSDQRRPEFVDAMTKALKSLKERHRRRSQAFVPDPVDEPVGSNLEDNEDLSDDDSRELPEHPSLMTEQETEQQDEGLMGDENDHREQTRDEEQSQHLPAIENQQGNLILPWDEDELDDDLEKYPDIRNIFQEPAAKKSRKDTDNISLPDTDILDSASESSTHNPWRMDDDDEVFEKSG